MPVAPQVTYPGVYIQEVPSDVRTIVPVDTATTAFVGMALRGPIDEPVIIHGFADFQRIFGGLWIKSQLGYSVHDFFLNGGAKAVIVRVFEAPAAEPADGATDGPAEEPAEGGEGAVPPAEEAPLSERIAACTGKGEIPGGLKIKGISPGQWSNRVKVEIFHPDEDIAGALGDANNIDKAEAQTTFFDLVVTDTMTGQREEHRNLTVLEEGPRRVDMVMEGSSLIRVDGDLPDARPGETGDEAAEAPGDGAETDADGAAPTGPVSLSGGLDGDPIDDQTILGDQAQKTGLYALEDADIFNLLVIPPYNGGGETEPSLWAAASKYCEERRAVCLVDPPQAWSQQRDKVKKFRSTLQQTGNHAAFFYPWVRKANPLMENRIESFPPSGIVAGVIARTDAKRGVWKAPAGLEAGLSGVAGLDVTLTDKENGELNPLGVNCLRTFPAAGHVVWGARTVEGNDQLASQWKYLPVRRTALFIEESLYRGTQWAVFEPNDEPLWAQLRLNLGTFMHSLFRQGAFQGGSPKDAYFVRCDANTTPQADIDRGIVNVQVGFAPLKPAEFVVLYIQQITQGASV